MTAAFDPDTAYAEDWRYMDRVKDAILHERDATGRYTGTSAAGKCLRQSVAESDLAAQAGALGLNPADTVITYWRLSDQDPAPRTNWSIVTEGVEWIVQRPIELTHGPKWQCIVGTALNKNEFQQL